VSVRLIAISDVARFGEAHTLERTRWLARAAKPGSLAVLLRDHELGARRRWELGRRLRGELGAAGQALWVADRIDLALALEADGLHLGEQSVSVLDARRLWTGFVSVALHDPQAPSAGADAVLLSPILAARKGRPALGVAALGRVRGARVFALGGVDAQGAAACLSAGAQGVAAIGAVFDADPALLLAALGID
jgi:thiamine-phosphate pyrophosphorylase